MKLNQKFGFIDSTGRLVIPAIYEETGTFSEGLCAVKLDNKWEFIDQNGSLKISQRFPEMQVRGRTITPIFQEGLALVDDQRFIDKNGEEFLKAREGLRFCSNFREGYACVENDKGLHGTINRKGEIAVEPRFPFPIEFHEGLARQLKKGKVGYIDYEGRFVIASKYEIAGCFAEGRAVVRENEPYC